MVMSLLLNTSGRGRACKVTDYIPWVLPNKKKLEYLQGLIKQVRLGFITGFTDIALIFMFTFLGKNSKKI